MCWTRLQSTFDVRFVVALICGLYPLQALALSCAPWTLEDGYARAAESEDAYVVVLGKIMFAERDLPQVNWDRQEDTPPETRVLGQIEGRALGPNGFETAFSTSFTLLVQCFGPWCAHVTDGARYLVFLRRVDGGYEMNVDPCTPMGWKEPTATQIETVVDCFENGRCVAPAR